VSPINLGLVVLAAFMFVGAAACAKLHVLEPAWWRLGGALVLYTAGNLVVIRVLREVGLGLAMSLSTVVQLVVVNLLAVMVFRERLSGPQYVGVALGVVAVVLMMLPARDHGS
jgi:small multidrug resistance pump